TILGAQFLVALIGLIKERSWKALFTMFSAMVFFAFVPRRLTPIVLSLSRAIDPDIVATVEDVRHTNLKWAGGGGTGAVLPTLSGRRFQWIHRRRVVAKPGSFAF
ncbi:MAG: hypothetical protein KKB50_15430, partial [Planctomycetes bacterium]|nr:hypothetical protein [Planctomycetota bacterium]